MMKQLLCITGLLLGAVATQAQTLTTTENQPISNYQTGVSPVDLQYLSSSVEGSYRVQQLEVPNPATAQPDSTKRLTEKNLPSGVRKVLRKDGQYNGWRDAGVYLDSATNLYVISIENQTKSITYNLNEDGKPVLITQSSR